MRCQRDLRELKKADALTQISQMEISPQHRRLVAGTRPATTLSPVAYISTGFVGCAWISHRQHRCCIPKIGVIGVRNKLRQQPMYSWPGTDASTGFVGCAQTRAHPIMSVEDDNFGILISISR